MPWRFQERHTHTYTHLHIHTHLNKHTHTHTRKHDYINTWIHNVISSTYYYNYVYMAVRRRCTCSLQPRTMCLPSASFLRHFSLAVAGLRAPLSRFLEGALYKYPNK